MRWLLFALLAGCSARHVSTGPVEVTPAMYLSTMTLVDVAEDDHISLEFPPQGGHVLFVGARVRNLDEPVASLRARLRSADDDSIIADEGRTVAFAPSPEDPTLKIPDLRSFSNVANVPVCPSYTAFDLYDHPFVLEVTVTEEDTGRSGSARRMVVPTCGQSDPVNLKHCQCNCSANYVLGKCSG